MLQKVFVSSRLIRLIDVRGLGPVSPTDSSSVPNGFKHLILTAAASINAYFSQS